MSDTLITAISGDVILKEEHGLLERVVFATKQTDPSYAHKLIAVLIKSVLDGTVIWDKNIIHSISKSIDSIDNLLSHQLSKIMQHNIFQKLEGSWRGLHYLVFQSETNHNLRIKVLDVSKKELQHDFDKSIEIEQSQLYKSIYENEYATPGGNPFGVLVGDYKFTNHPHDLDMLSSISESCAAAFCPFITSPAPELFGFDSWDDLAKPRDLSKIFDSAEYAKWHSFRNNDASRFVVMTMPEVLARLPYGAQTNPISEFNFDEFINSSSYCWMNAAYAYATCLTDAFAKYSWCTAIRGAESGGKISNLPLHHFKGERGESTYKCPTAVNVTDSREAELAKLGFLPLCHYKNTDYAVYFGAQTVHKPKVYDQTFATANAAISARMPYIMATSRFAHYLKILARDKIGSFKEAHDMQAWLNRWIMNYANANTAAEESLKAKYPLMEARIEVRERAGYPGFYEAVAWLRPWLQMEELTASMRLVAKIPKGKH